MNIFYLTLRNFCVNSHITKIKTTRSFKFWCECRWSVCSPLTLFQEENFGRETVSSFLKTLRSALFCVFCYVFFVPFLRLKLFPKLDMPLCLDTRKRFLKGQNSQKMSSSNLSEGCFSSCESKNDTMATRPNGFYQKGDCRNNVHIPKSCPGLESLMRMDVFCTLETNYGRT